MRLLAPLVLTDPAIAFDGGWHFFYVVLPSQNKLSARSAAVAANVHVAVISALLVTTTSAVLAPVTCDLGVEQRQRHL